MSDFDKLLEEELEKQKKKKKEQEKQTLTPSKTLGNSLSYLPSYNKLTASDIAPVLRTTRATGGGDFAPVQSKEDDSKLDFFQKGALGDIDLGKHFKDGFQFSDLYKAERDLKLGVAKAILGTVGDASTNAIKGVGSLVEGVTDLVGYSASGYAHLFGNHEAAERIKQQAQESTVDKLAAPLDNFFDKYSVLGRTSDSILQGVGQVGGILATGGLGSAAGLSSAGVTALTTGTMGLSGMGSGMGEAYQGGATDGEALAYGAISGAADALTELLFGGLGKAVNAVGLSKGLSSVDDMLAKKVSGLFKSQIAKNISEFGIKAGAEGFEEVLAGIAQGIGKHITYADDKELSEIMKDENLLEQFIVGAVTSGIAQAPGLHIANKTKTDFVTGQTQQEQDVLKKVVEDRIAELEAKGTTLTKKQKGEIEADVLQDMEKGYISTETIEEVLGGENYTAYQDTIKQENDALAELAELYEGDELKQRTDEFLSNSKRGEMAKTLSDSVYDMVKDSRLGESYRDRARRGQYYEADVTKYDEKQRVTIQRAIDSGVLNNTNRTHDMVDFIARVSANTGVLFDFTNNAKLKDSIFAVNGKTVDGYITKDGITINVNSPRYINTIVGHEITHAFEGTKQYEVLEKALFEYAKEKGTYKDVLKEVYDMYHGEEGYQGYEGLKKIKKEAVANLVGEYLFTDKNFVNHLSAKHQNIFQKVWNEVKYMVKIARAGSNEAKKLLEVQKAFEDAYRAGGKTPSDTKHSLSETTDGRFAAVVDNDILANIDTSSWDDNKKAEAKKAAVDALKQFSDGIVVGGITREVNRVSRREYTRSKDTERLYRKSPDVFADKMRAAEIADDIVVAATNWNRDGGLKHPRKDNFVDFDHGETLIVSGNSKYIAEVVVGITDTGDAVLYDVVDMTPTTFDIKKEESPSTATTQNAIGDILGDSSEANLAQKNPVVKGQFSLSDSEGKKLSSEQYEYFKDSKVVDENGNLKVMYHGTPNGDYTIFKDGTYFTDNKEYADRYQNPSASSISSGKVASSPKTFEVYLNIKKPFDINDAEARKIYIEDYIKGGNAMGINPYLSDAEYAKIKTIDWTEGEDLREFLIDNGYDYDGLVLDEGADGGYGDEVKSRGTSYVIFKPEQAKNIDNVKPTADKDIRFSLSKPVEETKELMAIHNLHSSELLKQLKMGGMPYPSIAITKPEMLSHDNFGEVSLVLHKNAIDPKTSKYNKVYSADAYTPTFPNVDYEANEDVADRIASKVNSLYSQLPDYYQRSVRSLRDFSNIDDELNRWGGEQRYLEKYADDYGLKQLYLAEKGEVVPVETKRTEKSMTDYQKYLYQTVVDKMGEDVLRAFNEKGNYEKLGLARMAWLNEHGDALKDIYAEEWSADGTMTKAEALEIANDQNRIYWKDEINRALDFIKTGGVTVTESDDISGTNAKIDEKIEGSDYKQWFENLFSGIEGQSGIRNGRDIFTPSGNRRSFSQTHDPLTVDNIVKAMRKENQTGQGAFGGGSILGASAQEYGSIAEIKRNAGRLGEMEKAEHDAVKERINDTFWDIAKRYANGKDIIDAQEAIAEAVSKNESKAGIARYLKQYDYVYNYTDSIGDEIIALRDYIRSLPTPYFESKPRRGVGFDEVAVFVIPRNADIKLKQELLNRGYNIAEYDPSIEGDRQRVVNGFEEYKFSLSNVGEEPKAYGNWHISGKDVAYEDIAPVREDAYKTKATVAENTTVPVVAENATTEELFPDDREELTNLLSHQFELRGALEAAVAVGDSNTMSMLTQEYEDVTARIRELEAQEAERFNSIDDADAPPEVETAHDEFTDTTPLNKKTVTDLTKKVKPLLGLKNNRTGELVSVIEAYSRSENASSEQLFNELKAKFGKFTDRTVDEATKEVKALLRGYRINVSDSIKSEIADYADLMRRNFGRVRFSKEGMNVDEVYEDLSASYPGYFPESIINPTDQLMQIINVANMEAETVSEMEVDDESLADAARTIARTVRAYQQSEKQALSNREARESFDSLMKSADEIAPADDIAPVVKQKEKTAGIEKPADDPVAKKDRFISQKAQELYNEIRNLRKGVKASESLGFLLDYGYEWRTIKTALLNIRDNPSQRVDQNSAIESIAREMLNEQYEDMEYELSELQAKAAKNPIKTVKERLTAKMQGLETELANNRRLREESWTDYDNEIARVQAEYNAKSNKNTVAANDHLRRIERLNRMKHNTDADYAKRISDLEARTASVAEEIRTGESTAEQGAMRQELYNRILSDIRTSFDENGFDFDNVLRNAKNLSTFATVDNTPQRVMEKALGYKQGQILSDLTVNKVAQNETEGIKWLNIFTDRKNGVLAKISKQYHIKPGSKESAAAQMYAEGFYVNGKNEIVRYGDPELAQDFPNATVRQNIKGLARDPRIRQIYDGTLDKINESRARNGYPEIQRLDNYFLHFRAMDDTFSKLGIPFNPNDIKAKDLPTDLNGVTADLKPGQPYFASAMHRTGKRTSYDLLGGLERYLSSAKNQIYHIDDIQTLRALRNYIADTYGQAHGLESLDLLTEEEAQERIEKVYGSHLSTFAKFLNEEANVIAGKTALIDRGLEGVIGRRGITFLNTVNKQVGSNMVGFNVSSSLTNFLPVAQTLAKTNKFDFLKAFAQTVSNKVGSVFGRGDSFAENSPVVIRRKGEERFYRTPWQKAADAGYMLMGAVDDISTELIARTKYNELTRKGMDSKQAHYETDKWVSRLMGDRSLGQQPQLYNSKMLGMITKFQLEVRNQLDAQFYDTIQETKASNEDIQNGLLRNAKTAAKVGSTFFQLAVAQHLFGKAFESVAGYNPAFDMISVLIKTLGWDDDEDDEDTVLDNVEEGFLELLGDLPYTSTLTGGRIPISSALPVEQFVTGKDQYGNEKSRWETLAEAAPYYVLPGGYGQAKKTYQGLDMFSDEHPVAGSYTNSGNLRFPVEDTFGNRVQAGLFGQYASENARDYFDNERSPLKPNQIQEYIDVDLPIREYWDYREGLSEHPTLDAKGDYIGGLDLPVGKKNILINNIAQREEPIDMTDYAKYPNFHEFDWAEQNEEKYAFLQEHGMSYSDYEKLDEDSKKAYTWAYNNPERYEFIKKQGLSATEYYSLDDDTKDAYSWAYDNPEMYTVSKAVSSDFLTYYQYKTDLSKLNAKNEKGESVSGLKKERVIDYINNLDIDYGQKIILFRSMYDGKADQAEYNADIVEYLNSRDDLSYEEVVTILKKLDFTVHSDGTVTW